jgi:hypothetical protein
MSPKQKFPFVLWSVSVDNSKHARPMELQKWHVWRDTCKSAFNAVPMGATAKISKVLIKDKWQLCAMLMERED